MERSLNRLAGVVLVAALLACPAGAARGAAIEIEVQSNRADLISGGDALVEIRLPAGAAALDLRVAVDGRDVSDAFALRPNGRVMGVVRDLAVGENGLTAQLPDGSASGLTITNHPIGGPVFSGEQVQPWACTTEAFGLGPPTDAQCNAPTQYRLRYRRTGGGFADYDPQQPPGDVATLTNDRGVSAPYVFLVETGTANRGIYRVAIPFDPAKPFQPWDPPAGWNGGLYWKFGEACGTAHSQGDPNLQSVEDNRALSRGYAVVHSTLNTLGTNCNTVTSGEAVMMLKEHIAESFGPIRTTQGRGCSGGSIGQYAIGNAYPGLLDGISPECSFEDVWTTAQEIYDCNLLVNYFSSPSGAALWPDLEQQAEVTGHQTIATCQAFDAIFGALIDPRTGCGDGHPYDPASNPGGCRGTLQDFHVGIFGRRPPELWTAPEQAIGRGFANWSYDNVGRLYGLRALQAGSITPEQFVDLNEKIGGVDIDNSFTQQRREADPGAVEIAYRSGLVNDGSTLDRIPIIDVRLGVSNAEFHTNYHSWAMRERLVRAHGHADNHVIWVDGQVPSVPSAVNLGDLIFFTLGQWIRQVSDDDSGDPLPAKVLRNRPAAARDACVTNQGVSYDTSFCDTAFGYYANPLIASGGPASNDVLKCQRKPLPVRWPDDGRYGPLPFSELNVAGKPLGQWDRLRAAFPDGVCDWSLPGADQVPLDPWTSFASGPGGEPLGPAPTSRPLPEPAAAPVLAFGALLLAAARSRRRSWPKR